MSPNRSRAALRRSAGNHAIDIKVLDLSDLSNLHTAPLAI
jgi:hypothetical protein